MRVRTFTTAGMLAGMALALVILAAVTVQLLVAEGAGYRALVTIWLWLLPFLGFFGAAGWLAGRAAAALGDRR
jgi:hypothetical protein